MGEVSFLHRRPRIQAAAQSGDHPTTWGTARNRNSGDSSISACEMPKWSQPPAASLELCLQLGPLPGRLVQHSWGDSATEDRQGQSDTRGSPRLAARWPTSAPLGRRQSGQRACAQAFQASSNAPGLSLKHQSRILGGEIIQPSVPSPPHAWEQPPTLLMLWAMGVLTPSQC